MIKAPFHRRILPWIFAIGFFVAAPTVVFYTSGYRWNPKKDKIERNGTLIVDSQPTKARIFLNGKLSDNSTPTTMQNVAPGKYVIKIEKDGYHYWEKQLEIVPEYVTFANDVWLWRQSDPIKSKFDNAYKIQTSQDENSLAILRTKDKTSFLDVWSPTAKLLTFDFPNYVSKETDLSWSPDSNSLFVEDRIATGTSAWLINVKANAKPIPLPSGRYRWNGNMLEGSTDLAKVDIKPTDGTISTTPFPNGTKDQFGDFALRQATGTDALVLFQDKNQERGLVLPSGDWRFYGLNDNRIILRDGPDWLSVDPEEKTPRIERVKGDSLRPFTEKKQTVYSTVQNSEVWIWNPTDEPELLSREGQSVKNIVWHSSGKNLALALEKDVLIMNLDSRDGKIRTPLTQFEEVYDIAILDKTLYIAAKKDGWTGMWELVIE
jgi:hypothetical protein